MNKQLTKNFNLSEFSSYELNEYQISLLQILANNIQVTRDELQPYSINGKPVAISIRSGVRKQADYDALKAKGRNPSATSDHFCGLQLLSTPTIGAADTVFLNCKLTHKEIALFIKELDKQGKVSFGQIIYEINPDTYYSWIHLGNDPKNVFTNKIAITRARYLMSLDNGKTYVTLE